MDGADPIIVEDLAGNIVDINAEVERVYQWTREELIGQNISMLVPPDETKQSQTLRRRCRNSEHVRNVESIRRDKNGKSHPVLLTLSLLSDEEGVPIGLGPFDQLLSDLWRDCIVPFWE
jgi:PAS domain S-box-containing protein